MDGARVSNTDANDEQSNRSTYLDYRSSFTSSANSHADRSVETPATETDLSSSGMAYPPDAGPTPLQARFPTGSQSSRPGSKRTVLPPSFMNYQPRPSSIASSQPMDIPRAASVATSEARSSVAVAQQGALLLFVAGEPHEQTVRYVETMLKHHRYSSLSIIGSQGYEAAVKQVRVDVYGILGRLGREMSVQTHLQEAWSSAALGAMMQQAGLEIQDVLISLAYGDAKDTGEDILALDQEQLAQSWQRSVGTLHTIAQATIPRLVERSAELEGPFRSFLILEKKSRSPAESVTKAACRSLLKQLEAQYASRSLDVNYAEKALALTEESVPTNGHDPVFAQQYRTDNAFDPTGSPTKLWAMASEFL
ncbi:hypothetical protein LTR86_007132 [Recurvomyces mirabilis]|nr:hypothetical protein LTR86_007132 [Recurvomyces mirabilis]